MNEEVGNMVSENNATEEVKSDHGNDNHVGSSGNGHPVEVGSVDNVNAQIWYVINEVRAITSLSDFEAGMINYLISSLRQAGGTSRQAIDQQLESLSRIRSDINYLYLRLRGILLQKENYYYQIFDKNVSMLSRQYRVSDQMVARQVLESEARHRMGYELQGEIERLRSICGFLEQERETVDRKIRYLEAKRYDYV